MPREKDKRDISNSLSDSRIGSFQSPWGITTKKDLGRSGARSSAFFKFLQNV